MYIVSLEGIAPGFCEDVSSENFVDSKTIAIGIILLLIEHTPKTTLGSVLQKESMHEICRDF